MSWEYRDILPAMQLSFDEDLSIDEVELRRFTKWLAGHKQTTSAHREPPAWCRVSRRTA